MVCVLVKFIIEKLVFVVVWDFKEGCNWKKDGGDWVSLRVFFCVL